MVVAMPGAASAAARTTEQMAVGTLIMENLLDSNPQREEVSHLERVNEVGRP
jgi:hypothetical protein